jgi:S-layer protein
MASIWTSAAQAAQQGFVENYYLSAKAAQMSATGTTWTVDMVKAAFASAGLEAYQHYQQYGFKEGLNPNAYFNNSYYNASKATAASITESAFQSAWNNVYGGSETSTYFHYLQYGYNEAGVNPASTFNEAQYYVDKAALMTAQTGTTWTVDMVKTAFANAGLTPLTHYILYGGTPAEPTPQPVSGGTGTTYYLTTGTDNIPGTALDDTIVAGEVGTAKTLTGGDNINGAGGTNTINVFDTGAVATNYAGFTMQNVQVLNATSDGAGMTFDLSGTTGLTSINSVNSSANVTANQVTSLANVGVTNLTNPAANVTVVYQDAVVAGAADTVAVTLNNSKAGNITLGDATASGVETVAITATGGDTTLTQLNSNITNLTFTGDKNLTITNALNNTVKTIDAGTATGGLSVGIGAGNANDVTFTGGSGADTITFAAGTLGATDRVTGGTGNDTLVAQQADLAAAGAAGRVTGVETIQVSTAALTGTFEADNFTDATTFTLANGYAAGATLNDLSATQTRVNLRTASAGVLNLDDAGTSAVGESFTIGLGSTTVDVAATGNVNFKSGGVGLVENITVISNSLTTGFAGNTLNITDQQLTNLTIQGKADLTLTTTANANNALNSVDGSTATGDLILTGLNFAANSGVTVLTGSGNDTVTSGNVATKTDTINTGDGNDIVNGTQGVDNITLGNGNDRVVYTALNQSNSAATDAIADFVSGADVVDTSGLGNTAFNGNFATYALANGALTGGGTVSSVFQQDANTLWVDMDGNGTLDANDFRVVLSGTASLTAADVGLATIFPVVAGVANNATSSSTIFTGNGATIFAPGTTITGLSGTNTLMIQDDPTVGGAKTLVGVATNIEVVNLLAGNTVAALTIHNQDNVVVNASAAANVTLGANKGQSFNGSAAGDTLTLGTTNQSAAMAAGADFINSTVANLADANLDFGTGTDTLTLTNAGAVNLLGGAGNTTVANLEIVTLTGASTLAANISGLTVNAGAGATTVTNAGSSQTVVATNLNGADLTIAGSAATTVNDLEDNLSDVTFNAGVGASRVNVDVTGGATAHTITSNTANLVTVDAVGGFAGAADTVTLTGTGNFAVTNAGGVGGMDITIAAGSSGNVSLSSLDGALALIAGGTGTVSVDATGLTAALTVTGAQNVTVTGLGGTGSFAGAGGTGNYNITTVAGTGAITTSSGADTIAVVGTGARTITSGLGIDQISLDAATVGTIQSFKYAAAGATNVDTITGSYTLSEDTIAFFDGNISTQLGNWTISYGDGTSASSGDVYDTRVTVAANGGAGAANASGAGLESFVFASSLGATSFANALGTSTVTVAGQSAGEAVLFTWYDSATGQAVIGLVDATTDGVATNISASDTFQEVGRIEMTGVQYSGLTTTDFAAFF